MTPPFACHCEETAWNAGDEAISVSLVEIAAVKPERESGTPSQ